MPNPDIKMRVTFQRVGVDDFRFSIEAIKANGEIEKLRSDYDGNVVFLKVGQEIVMEVGPNG